MVDHDTLDFGDDDAFGMPTETATPEAEYQAPANRPARNARQATSVEDVPTHWLHEGATDFLGLEQDLSAPPIVQATQSVFHIPLDEPLPTIELDEAGTEDSWLLSHPRTMGVSDAPPVRDTYAQAYASDEDGEPDDLADDPWDEHAEGEVGETRRSPLKLAALLLAAVGLGVTGIAGFELAQRRGLLERFSSDPVVVAPPAPVAPSDLVTEAAQGEPGPAGEVQEETLVPDEVALTESPLPDPPALAPEATDPSSELAQEPPSPSTPEGDPLAGAAPEPTVDVPVVEPPVAAPVVAMGEPGPRSPADLLREAPSEPFGPTLVTRHDPALRELVGQLVPESPIPFLLRAIGDSTPRGLAGTYPAEETDGLPVESPPSLVVDGAPVAHPARPNNMVFEPDGALPLPMIEGPIRLATSHDVAGIWQDQTIPLEAIAGVDRILTPYVGPVRTVLRTDEVFEGRLFAVGQGQIWLESKLGRLALTASSIASIHQLVELSTGSEAYAGLPRVRVRTPGGVFLGREIARDAEKITLITDQGARVTLRSHSIEVDNDTHTVVVKAVEGESVTPEVGTEQ